MRRKLIAFVLAGVMIFGVACGSDGSSPEEQDRERKTKTIDALITGQPAKTASYSPTRETMNFWVDTWGNQPGKLSFVYMSAANGQLVGYYVLKGLPVSYCASLTEPTKFVNPHNDNTGSSYPVPAAGMDGAYYSGGQCNQYYGVDATTGTYIEFSIGASRDYILSEEPLPRQDVEPLGVTTTASVEEFRTNDGDYVIP